jgi:predicted Zn-dependent protease
MIEGHERTILAAQGYSELGMFDEAIDELNSLPDEAACNSTVIELRTVILMQAKRWKSALAAGRDLCRAEPAKTSGFIHTAFCLHELGRTAEARDVLLSGPEALHSEPTYHYNLACYECALGHLDLARMHLEKSFQLDKKMREFALSDPDLAALRE